MKKPSRRLGAEGGIFTGVWSEFTCGLLIIAWFCSCYFLS